MQLIRAAITAFPEKLQGVRQFCKPVLAGNLTFQLLHRADTFQGRDRSAVRANQMVAMVAAIGEFEVARRAAQMHLAGEFEFLQQRHHPENRGEIGGVATLGVFVRIEFHVADPMFRLRLFQIRAFTAGNVAALLGAVSRGGLQRAWRSTCKMARRLPVIRRPLRRNKPTRPSSENGSEAALVAAC